MEQNPIPALLKLADVFAAHKNISHWRASFLARGDGGFFNRLKAGRGCNVKTALAVFGWFDANWPTDLEWPRDIPRPSETQDAA